MKSNNEKDILDELFPNYRNVKVPFNCDLSSNDEGYYDESLSILGNIKKHIGKRRRCLESRIDTAFEKFHGDLV